jgi:hypothetical protein
MPKVLTVDFNLATPDTGSYRVKFWPNNDTNNITTTLVQSSPFIAYDLNYCAYSGTIESVCPGGIYSAPQSFTVNLCPSSISYTPCSLISSDNLSPSAIYLAPGVTDVAPGVQLYNVNGGAIQTVTFIADSNGMIYSVDSSGVVGSWTGNVC